MDIIFIVAMLACLIVPWAVFGLWWWFWMMTAIGVVFGIFEIASKISTGKTLSQRFWKWSTEKDDFGERPNIWKAWLVLGVLLSGWLMLLGHLAWKMVFSQ